MSSSWIIKQIKSGHGQSRKQKACLRGLGLRGIGKVKTHADHPAIRGMIGKVQHLVVVEKENKKS